MPRGISIVDGRTIPLNKTLPRDLCPGGSRRTMTRTISSYPLLSPLLSRTGRAQSGSPILYPPFATDRFVLTLSVIVRPSILLPNQRKIFVRLDAEHSEDDGRTSSIFEISVRCSSGGIEEKNLEPRGETRFRVANNSSRPVRQPTTERLRSRTSNKSIIYRALQNSVTLRSLPFRFDLILARI